MHTIEIDRSIPWNEGGKENFLDASGLTMTNDELAVSLGDAYQKIVNAGFVLVPKRWRDDVFRHLQQCSRGPELGKEAKP